MSDFDDLNNLFINNYADQSYNNLFNLDNNDHKEIENLVFPSEMMLSALGINSLPEGESPLTMAIMPIIPEEPPKPKINVMSVEETNIYFKEMSKQSKIEKFQKEFKANHFRKNQPEGLIYNEIKGKFEKLPDIERIDKEIDIMMKDKKSDMKNFYAKSVSKEMSEMIMKNPEMSKELITSQIKKMDIREAMKDMNKEFVNEILKEDDKKKRSRDVSKSRDRVSEDRSKPTKEKDAHLDKSKSKSKTPVREPQSNFNKSVVRDKSECRPIIRDKSECRTVIRDKSECRTIIRDKSECPSFIRDSHISPNKFNKSYFNRDNSFTRDKSEGRSVIKATYRSPNKSYYNNSNYNNSNYNNYNNNYNYNNYNNNNNRDNNYSNRDNKNNSFIREKSECRSFIRDKSEGRSDNNKSPYRNSNKDNSGFNRNSIKDLSKSIDRSSNIKPQYETNKEVKPISLTSSPNFNKESYFENKSCYVDASSNKIANNSYRLQEKKPDLYNQPYNNTTNYINKYTAEKISCPMSPIDLNTPPEKSSSNRIDLTSDDAVYYQSQQEDLKRHKIRDELQELVVNLKYNTKYIMANGKSTGDKDKLKGNEVSNKLLCDLKSISQDSSFIQLINCLDFVKSNMKITQDSVLKEYIAFRDKSIGASPDMLILTSFYFLWSYENLVRSRSKISSSDELNNTSHTSKNDYNATTTNHTTDLPKRSKSIFKNRDTNMNQSYLNREEAFIKTDNYPLKICKPIAKEEISKGVGDIIFGSTNTNTSMISSSSSISRDKSKKKVQDEHKSFLKQKRKKEEEDITEIIPEKKRKFEKIELESSKENLNINLKPDKKKNKEKSEMTIPEGTKSEIKKNKKIEKDKIEKQEKKEKIEEMMQNDSTYNMIMKLAHRITNKDNFDNLKKLIPAETADLIDKAFNMDSTLTVDLYNSEHYKIYLNINSKDNKYSVCKKIKEF